MSELIVAKAGGTSNCDPAAVTQSLQWAEQADIFVCSAPGKLEGDGPAAGKVTDMLLSARDEYCQSGEVSPRLAGMITDRYDSIVRGLGAVVRMPGSWVDAISPRISEAARQGEDIASMLGERLQAEIYQGAGFALLDPGRSPHDLGSDPEAWRGWLGTVFKPGERYILPGNTTRVAGQLRTFSRGGSDISGGLAAYGIGAAMNLNLTDGPAMSADPRLIAPYRLNRLRHLLYEEGRELGRNGTGLVHPAAMVPLMLGSIPTQIHNTFEPDSSPTLLDNDTDRARDRIGHVVAISLMEEVTVHRVHEPGMAERVGRLAAFESALARSGIGLLDSQGDGVDAQRYFVESEFAAQAAEALRTVTERGIVETSGDLSFITLVGYRLDQKVLTIIGAALSDINGGLWQGHDLSTGRHSIRISVDPSGARDVLSGIHRATIELAA
jgi:aspartate kinase